MPLSHLTQGNSGQTVTHLLGLLCIMDKSGRYLHNGQVRSLTGRGGDGEGGGGWGRGITGREVNKEVCRTWGEGRRELSQLQFLSSSSFFFFFGGGGWEGEGERCNNLPRSPVCV